MATDPPAPGPFHITVDAAAAGQRVDRFVAATIGTISRSRVKTLIEEARLTTGGRVITEPAEAVRAGATYTLAIPHPAPATPRPQAIPFTILFEDADLIVLDKPAGLVVHPAPGNLDGTLVNALLAHCGPGSGGPGSSGPGCGADGPDPENLRATSAPGFDGASAGGAGLDHFGRDDGGPIGSGFTGIGGERRPGIVHRLDKDTSGVMVVAKTQLASHRLTAAFAARDLDRTYLALVWGLPVPLVGEIEAAIGRDRRDRKRMAVVTHGGKAALTRYRTLRAWQTSLALLECRLATGRTHQIRVHLATRGHPLVGDPVYLRRMPAAARGVAQPLRSRLLDFPRQALHAASLGFAHPRTGQPVSFQAAPPEDMTSLIQDLDRIVPPN